MSVTRRTMTADELFRLPDDGYRYELVRGELRKMTPAGFSHGAVVANLTVLLGQHVRAHALGVVCGAETGFKIAGDPDTVRAPDIAFVRRERIPASGLPLTFWRGAPDLGAEVLSLSDTPPEVDEKINEWLAAGTLAVWIVDPKSRTVTIYRSGKASRTLAETEILDGEDVVPGFRPAVASIFTV